MNTDPQTRPVITMNHDDSGQWIVTVDYAGDIMVAVNDLTVWDGDTETPSIPAHRHNR